MHEVVRIARDWIGTPYRHQGTTKGVGLSGGEWQGYGGKEGGCAESAGHKRELLLTARTVQKKGPDASARPLVSIGTA